MSGGDYEMCKSIYFGNCFECQILRSQEMNDFLNISERINAIKKKLNIDDEYYHQKMKDVAEDSSPIPFTSPSKFNSSSKGGDSAKAVKFSDEGKLPGEEEEVKESEEREGRDRTTSRESFGLLVGTLLQNSCYL